MALFKYGVNPFLGERIHKVLPIIDEVHRQTLMTRWEAIITSANDGEHMHGSKHYTGEAIDLRIIDISMNEARDLALGLKKALGDDWDVILEKDHIHVEYDPKPEKK